MATARTLLLAIGALGVVVISFLSTSYVLNTYLPIREVAEDKTNVTGSILHLPTFQVARLGSSGANLVWPSEDFASPRWARNQIASIEPHAGRAPNGENTASRIVESKDNGRHFIDITLAGASPRSVHSFSVYFKPIDRLVRLEIRDNLPGKYGNALCNPPKDGVAGTVIKGGDVLDGGVEDAGDGWYRCWAAMPFDLPTAVLAVELRNQIGVFPYQGDGASGLLIWGAQFEPNVKPGTYTAALTGPIAKAN